jgi:hypothetical protein
MSPDTTFNRGEKLEGHYANFFKVGYNAYEIVFDFGQSYCENEKAELYARIITSPFYAKTFLTTLQRSIKAYEKQYGPIKEP